MLFASPPDKDLEWSNKGVEGCFRFINRVWRLINKYQGLYSKEINLDGVNFNETLKGIRIELHRTIKIVTYDIHERMQYNTAIARMMELVNTVYKTSEDDILSPEGKIVISEVFSKLVPLLAPFVPHIAEEMWELLGYTEMIINYPWPDYIEELTTRDEIEIVFQVNGKIRSKVKAPYDISKSEMEKMALADNRIIELTDNKEIKKVIIVPGKLVNIVVK